MKQWINARQLNRRSKKHSQQVNSQFTILTDTKLTRIEREGKSAHLELHQHATKETYRKKVDGMFVFIGQTPATDLISDVIQTDHYGYILTTPEMNTDIVGVFAAGDINSKRYRQLTTAMSDGTIAALEAHRYLCA